jgi:hypothetical protein
MTIRAGGDRDCFVSLADITEMSSPDPPADERNTIGEHRAGPRIRFSISSGFATGRYDGPRLSWGSVVADEFFPVMVLKYERQRARRRLRSRLAISRNCFRTCTGLSSWRP